MTSTTLPLKCHPLAPQLAHSVHASLDQAWPFSSEKYKSAFFTMDFPPLLALICPEGPLDRLKSTALFVCLTGILDDASSQMSIESSRKIGVKLLGIMQGTAVADPSSPLEKFLAGIVDDMNAQNAELAKGVLAGAVALFHAQTDKARLAITQLNDYFAFRYRDIGGEFFTAILRFVNDIPLSGSEREKFKSLEGMAIRNTIVTNDIISWEKEVKEATESNQEGAAVFSAVPILARNLGIGFEGAKRVLGVAVRELEKEIEGLAGDLNISEGKRYVHALEHLASGNEEWCRTTIRYRVE
ncbi:isoprenoid synthase domain-containing protein [Aspergillus aurantiobrunneus]